MIIARIVWVFPGAYLPRRSATATTGRGDPYPPWQSVAVVAWTGMRGVVSLAAAMALPASIDLETRSLIQFITFWVIFATLVLQGLSLPLLIRALRVEPEPDFEEASC